MPLDWSRRLRRAALLSLASLGLLMLVVTFTPLVCWWSMLLAGDWPEPRGDVLVVLSAEMVGDDMIGLNSYWRSVYGVRVYRGGEFREVIVAGARIAPLVREFMVCQGIPPGVIRVENESHTTRENALFTARMLEGAGGRTVLVTSDLHMFRAQRTFRKAGLEVVPSPFPYGIKRAGTLHERWVVFVDLTIETAKIAYYFARGWI